MDKVHTRIPVFRPKRTKNRTLRGGTYLYSLFKGVLPGIPALNKIFERFLSRQMHEFYNGLLSDFISAHRKCHSWDLFAEFWEVRWRGTFYPVADLGEGRGPPAPPLFLYQTETRRAEKIFLETGYPPCLRVWMTPPPSAPYLNVWIRHCYHLVNLKQLPMALTPFVTFQLSSRMHYRYRV